MEEIAAIVADEMNFHGEMADAPDSSRQIRRGRAHKDRPFVLFSNHGGRQKSSDPFALIRISTF